MSVPVPQVEGGFYSKRSVEFALDKYRRACSEATQAVKMQLKQLSQQLQVVFVPACHAAMYCRNTCKQAVKRMLTSRAKA